MLSISQTIGKFPWEYGFAEFFILTNARRRRGSLFFTFIWKTINRKVWQIYAYESKFWVKCYEQSFSPCQKLLKNVEQQMCSKSNASEISSFNKQCREVTKNLSMKSIMDTTGPKKYHIWNIVYSYSLIPYDTSFIPNSNMSHGQKESLFTVSLLLPATDRIGNVQQVWNYNPWDLH